MNEELLQLAYSKINTDASYEQFKADFQADEALRRLSYSKMKTDASYEDFIKDIGFSKKAEAVSTESPSDSAQQSSTSDMSRGAETKQELESSSKIQYPSVEFSGKDFIDEPNIDLEISALYDQYKEAGKISLPQQKAIRQQLDKQEAGDRSIWEDIDAFATGMLNTGMMIPIYKYNTEEELLYKRSQKNKTDFLSKLPEDKVKELNDYAVNRTIKLNNTDKNILAQNKILEEKSKTIVKNLGHLNDAAKKLKESGRVIPQELIDDYSSAYDELEGIARLYNDNVDIIEADQEDIGSFYEELDLLKKNYGGLDYYKDVARLSTADMLAGLMEFGITVGELMPANPGLPVAGTMQFPEATQFTKEFRDEISRQRETLRPQLSVNDIESIEDFGSWLAEQTATQLPTLTVLAASGGTTGLATIGASSAGQKFGSMKDSNTKGETNYSQSEIFLAGTAVGLSEVLSERVSLGILSKGKRVLNSAVKNGVEDQVRRGFGNFVKSNLIDAGKEGTSEFANQVAQNLIDKLYLGNKDVHVFDGAVDALASGGMLGSGMNAFPVVIGMGAKAFMPKEKADKVNTNSKAIESLINELESNENLNKNSKDYIRKKIDNLTKETEKDFKDTFSKIENMDAKDIQELIDLDKKSNKILDEVKDIESSTLSDEMKLELKQANKAKIERIKQRKTELLDKSSSSFEGLTDKTKIEYLDKAARELSKEKKEAGIKDYELTDKVIRNRAEKLYKKDIEDGSKQDAQQKPEEVKESISQEAITTEANKKGEVVNEGTEGGDSVQGKVREESGLDNNGEGVQQNSVGVEGIDDGEATGKSDEILGETTIDEFSRIDLAEEVGINKAIKILDSWEKNIDKFGKENLSVGIPVVVAKAAISTMKAAAKTAKSGADVISAGLNYIKNTAWYQGLSDSDKQDVKDNFINYVNNPSTQSEGITNRQTVEAKLDEGLAQGKPEWQIIDEFPTEKEKMLAKDIINRRKSVDPKTALKNMRDSYDKAQKEMTEKKSSESFFSKGLRRVAKNIWDRQYLPKMLLMKAGGKTVRNFIITAKGASGFAKYNFDLADDTIYNGLSDSDIDMLNQIILQKRFIAIDDNRASRGLDPVVHPDFQNKQTSEAALSALKDEIGDKKYNNLSKRAENYFESFKELLDDMYESGIVSQEFRDSFMDVNYQPRVFLKFLTNQEQEMSIIEMGAPESASLGAKQIQNLEEGSADALITDSMYLLGRSMNTRAKSVAMNNTNKRLVEFMSEQAKVVEKLKQKDNLTRKEKRTVKYFEELQKRVKDNPIVGFTKSGNPKYKYAVKSNEKAQTYYVDGVKHQMIMEETFFDQYNDNLKAIFNNSNVREKVALASMTGLVKTIATGNNPAFFITNSPRDFMFIATFSEEYGANILSNLVRISKDSYQGIKDMRKDTDTFKQFVKHGGMLDYLHTQGKFKGTTATKRLIDKVFDNQAKELGSKVFNWATLNKLQVYSEIGFRMGVFRRSIKNQLGDLGLKNIEDATPRQREDIYVNAAASARNTTDFSQGGIYTKDVDALIPYLNAGVQGTRVAIENLHERPVETMLRMAQSAAILSAVPIGLSLWLIGSSEPGEEDKDLTPTERYFKALDGVSLYDRTNYQIIFTGNKTEDGEYEFIRISKPHFLTPLISYAQSLQHNVMREGLGMEKESAIDAVKFALEKNISPVEMSVTGNLAKNPILKASLTYTTGYDFYRDQDLSYLRGDVPVPVEGHESKAVEQFYKDVGEDLLISPARMKGAVESMITTPSTSPFVGILYGGLDVFVSDKDAMDSADKVAKTMLRSVTGRVRKETSEYNRRKDWDKEFLREFSKKEIDVLKEKRLVKDLANKLSKGEVTNEEVNSELERIANKDVFEFKRLMETFKEAVSSPKKDVTIIDLKFRKPYERALILASIYGDSLLDEKAVLSQKNKALKDELFSNKIMNQETIIKYLEIVGKK